MTTDNKIPHANYADETFYNDIALITLPVPIATNGSECVSRKSPRQPYTNNSISLLADCNHSIIDFTQKSCEMGDCFFFFLIKGALPAQGVFLETAGANSKS